MEKVDSYGMKSGIIKVIPPDEWRQRQPPLDDIVKQVTVKQPIKQDIMGSNGTYRQVNILHQRSYNLPQWRQLCDQSEHQPPARRGERRLNADKPRAAPRPRAAAPASTTEAKAPKSGGRRSTRGRGKSTNTQEEPEDAEDRPMTPVSPQPEDAIMDSVEQDPGADIDPAETTPRVGRMGAVKMPKEKVQSTSARRKFARREASARIDEEAFKDFDYKMDISDYTPERCEELERIYWKTLTYAQPLYGADMPGTLFNDETETWNLGKLPNLLDVLGTKIPGVNTAYLYLGMWKATFAWHLEDVDLYSINYLHFGAPKQWYSISQGDARRFEAAMKSIWPTDAQACDQFLRHKAFLISPNHLKQHFNIKVNKCVSYPGEFVVTYPYGYHSGYNLGYNCAEAVNFALDSWLPMGKIAKRCECAQAQDSVWIDVNEIERKLRGESTDYEETEDEEDEEDEEEDEEEEEDGPGLVPSKSVIKIRVASRKRKRASDEKGERKKVKKIRLRVKASVEPTCCLCPHDIAGAEILPTDDGRKAHRMCALYGPEVWVETVDGQEVIANAGNISKARLDLKCLYCRSKRGICFQCSHKKCTRAYHATCAAAAGVLVEEGEVPLFGEDGTEYKEQAFEFTCRFHRSKRDKKTSAEALEACEATRTAAASLQKGEVCQLQFYRGDIFAGIIVENRADEETFLVDVVPNGDRVEVEWKYLLLPDPADLRLPKASPNAIPMPSSRKAKELINASKREEAGSPRADEAFVEGHTWAEFKTYAPVNRAQAKIDLSKQDQLWHYLGKTSTEARAQYSEDPRVVRHNTRSNFLDTLPRPPPTAIPPPPRFTPAPHSMPPQSSKSPVATKTPKPYAYKPKPVTAVPAPFVAPQPVSAPMPAAVPTATDMTFTAQQFVPPAAVMPAPKVPIELPVAPMAAPPQPSQTNSNASAPVIPPPPHPSKIRPFATPKLKSSSKHGHTRNSLSLHSVSSSSKITKSHSRMRNYSFSFGSSFGNKTSAKTSPFSLGFMQPQGLGASPSPQNGSLFQAQARARSNSTVSTKSFTVPMTSAAIRPSSSASNQSSLMHTQAPPTPVATSNSHSVVVKYAFFQLNHNKDSSKYRTPYAPWGGFTNGYEGNLRAHLMKTPDALFSAKKDSSARPGTAMSAPVSANLSPFTPGTPSRKAKAKQGFHPNLSQPSVFGSWDSGDFSVISQDSLELSSKPWGHRPNGGMPQVQRSNVAPRKARLSQSAPSSSPMATVNTHSRSKSTQVPLSNVFNNSKQTYVPPPRPWESLKQPVPSSASIPMNQFHGMTNGFSAPSPYSTLAANSPHSAMTNPFNPMMFGPSPFVHNGPSPTLPVMGSAMEGSPFGNDADVFLGESGLEDVSEPSDMTGSFWPKFEQSTPSSNTNHLGHDSFPSSSMFGHDHFPSPPWNPY
ncbi:uncharacterized protein B0I36DRAFT_13421 [Microdochium trichocladiopsis]|uniref:[histone H3]-trimethyl-L-lysine(9) demethylase n=1 Tax=Microdochium trichocladiopsis TaxID=1682393 RepID=A0A9P9BVU2_9PEZI|nr:uncharacterized protein B0I36DRAFT_13421 [Microdochium trichocladiopsis]KAH7040648.1 hypothetical protein B0I36DRAFT_13421 [Microdochium trichocladiopsis]